ncbi:MAG: hypothetical protein RI995_606 [Bacteroidota bacterium]|jgi:hypothetical protein
MIKKGYTLYFCMLLSISLFGQSKKYTQIFHEYYDNKPIHFGFQFGFLSARYMVTEANSIGISSPGNFGFFVGGSVNYALNAHFEAKSGINVALYNRRFVDNNTATPTPYYRESTWLEMPLLMKFRAVRRKNHRAFLVAGTKVSWESNRRASTNLLGQPYDLTIEYGFGLERFNKYFKFSPEIRFSNGLLNLYSNANNLALEPNLKSNTITLILNFE